MTTPGIINDVGSQHMWGVTEDSCDCIAAVSCISYYISYMKTKPEWLNVPPLFTTRASTVQGGRRVALHAFYNPQILQDIF